MDMTDAASIVLDVTSALLSFSFTPPSLLLASGVVAAVARHYVVKRRRSRRVASEEIENSVSTARHVVRTRYEPDCKQVIENGETCPLLRNDQPKSVDQVGEKYADK